MRLLFVFTMAITACNANPVLEETGDSEETGLEPEGFPSSFEMGSYRITALSLNELGDGVDQNGDQTPDNNLPNALILVDVAISDQDFSLEGFNTLMASSIDAKILNILVAASHIERNLDLTIFSGVWNEATDTYEIADGSYDEDGEPLSNLLGHFESETDFGVSALTAVLPVTFILEDGPLPVPLVNVTLTGTLEEELLSGQISGAIPGEAMINNVIAPMIPEEGAGGKTREELLEMVQSLTTNETLMDVPMADGKQGISASFRFQATRQNFENESSE